MEPRKTLLNQEATILDNVINKLQVYMDQNDQTLYGLAYTMGFAYQPFYRLMTKKHLPTLNSLTVIAEHFNCTVAELIHEDMFLDIDCFDSIEDAISIKRSSKIRIYVPYDDYLPLMYSNFFAIQTCSIGRSSKQKNDDMLSICGGNGVFHRVDTIGIDGIFLVNYKSKNILLEVLSISSKFVNAILDGKEIRIDTSTIKPIAQFFNYLTLINKDQPIIIGVTK